MLALGSLAIAQPADLLPSIPKGTIAIGLQPVATGLAAPDYAISPPGDTHRLFVIEQNGLLRVVTDGVLQPSAALDLSTFVQRAPVGTGPLNPANANDERGFLGLAFNPGFNDPNSVGFRTLYTYTSEAVNNPTYPAPAGAVQNYQNQITEWKMSAANPNVVDPTSRRVIISFGKNAGNHNGGTIAYSPDDGYLYLATGDGGDANDVGASHVEPGGNAQNLNVALGKFLRIDPTNPSLTPGSADPISANGQYRIPADNPTFGGAPHLPEIYAYGFRNPYRYAFDTATNASGKHDLILSDVGQNNVEEIDRVVKGGNFGWSMKEGDFLFNRTTGPGGAAGSVGARSPGSPAGLIDPISGPGGTAEYDHQDGISITGGFVYHGTALPELDGKYVFGDLALRANPTRADGRLFYADIVDGDAHEGEIHEFLLPQFAAGVLPNGLTVHGFGQDGNGELYALVTNTPSNGTGGIVYKIVVAPEPGSIALLSLGAGLLSSRRRRRER
jgi:glucose/arabinose dehydrogenase